MLDRKTLGDVGCAVFERVCFLCGEFVQYAGKRLVLLELPCFRRGQ